LFGVVLSQTGEGKIGRAHLAEWESGKTGKSGDLKTEKNDRGFVYRGRSLRAN